MKIIKTYYVEQKVDRELEVTGVFHDLPRWVVRHHAEPRNPVCTICHKDLWVDPNIAYRPPSLDSCTALELDGYSTALVHTDCYHKLASVNQSETASSDC